MFNITKFLVLLLITISCSVFAQEKETDKENIPYKENGQEIDRLKELKKTIENEEREFLKSEVEIINTRLDKEEITEREAEELKREMAKKRALNIENRIAIIDNKIALLRRNDETKYHYDDDDGFIIRIGSGEDTSEKFIYLGDKKYDKPRKYDRRTSSDLVLAFGLNNAIVEGEGLDDSPYKFGGSRFFEIGWAWKTRVFKNSNALRLKYGYSFMINGLKPTDNMYFVEDGDITTLEEFPVDLKKSKLSITNLVFPLHFEFGPSKKIEKKTYFRYSTNNQFKVGIGGYAGFNIGTRQKLKYTEDGERVKDKIKRDFNTRNLVYGLSAYVAFDEVALYAKYDLSPIFKDQVVEQNNISLGVRFDMD